jgi:hypothetical protein
MFWASTRSPSGAQHVTNQPSEEVESERERRDVGCSGGSERERQAYLALQKELMGAELVVGIPESQGPMAGTSAVDAQGPACEARRGVVGRAVGWREVQRAWAQRTEREVVNTNQ